MMNTETVLNTEPVVNTKTVEEQPLNTEQTLNKEEVLNKEPVVNTKTVEEPKKKKPRKRVKKKRPTIAEVDTSNPEEVDLRALKKAELVVLAEGLQAEKKRAAKQSAALAIHGPLLTNTAHKIGFTLAARYGVQYGWELPEWDAIPADGQNTLNQALIEVLAVYLPDVETSPLATYAGVLALTMMQHARRIPEDE